MARNIDMTALRSFVMVAETGGVTRAAARLHLTQSAVSMQLKRLEEMLGQPLLDRSGRGVALTLQGEQLLSFGKRILELNDEVWSRMTDTAYSGEVRLGVPHDIVYPYIPEVLHRFHHAYPRIRVTLDSSYTRKLKRRYEAGEIDVILTTEDVLDAGGETLDTPQLVWVGAPGGSTWRNRPLRLAFENICIFRAVTQSALDSAGIDWEMAVNSDNTRSVEAAVSADLAIHACIDTTLPPYFERIRHTGALPELPHVRVNMYAASGPDSGPAQALAGMIREAYRGASAMAAQ
ncbi:LysR family transcriptional regulator [Paroceanicella profunda]|uniref:LysR family transcriptional regulator n=1 Tax=Paroceanicella profunda TaxID=2579971 RepID=A0A5B8FQ58_9RHOB|nr:LysR family transcriptional regulator [Paroceanicella profunda]QDL90726.1 LysR family transcriptional regulator [Paroceanicella profunda]